MGILLVAGPLVSQPCLAPRKVPIAVFYGPAPLLSSHSLHTISNGFVSQTIESVYQSLSPWHNVHNTQQPQEAVVIVSSKVKDHSNATLPYHFPTELQCVFACSRARSPYMREPGRPQRRSAASGRHHVGLGAGAGAQEIMEAAGVRGPR